MEKQKFFLILAVIGALVIFLQQDSLQLTNRHLNKSNSNFELRNHSGSWQLFHSTYFPYQMYYHSSIFFRVDAPKAVQEWPYNKFIHELSKSLKDSKGKKSREKMKSWLSGFNPLSRFPVYVGPNVTRVLLLGYFRSGSSFVGDLMQQNWKSFYTFEPLHLMTRYTRIEDVNLTQALNLITGIFTCDFKRNSYYVKWLEKNQFLLRWNKFLWNVCRFRPESCFDSSYMTQACQRSKYNIVKVVRLPLKHMEILWKQIAFLNVKVVYLVRDPRGIYNSRKNMEWCNKEQVCADIGNICAEMRQDLEDFDRLKPVLGKNLHLARYEDISLDPLTASKKLFSSLKLDYTPSVSRFVKTHTKSHHQDVQNPYSTYRANSSSTAFQWMQQLNSSEIEFAQHNCSDILARLNYQFV